MNIFKVILCIVFLNSSFSALGQEYLFIDRNEIKSLLDSTAIMRDSSNFLFITLPEEGRVDVMYRFNNEKICDSIEMKFYCHNCLEFYLEDLLSDKSYKWCKVGKESYLSKKRPYFEIWLAPKNNKIGSILLTIKKTPEKKICATATYHLFITDAKSWKNMTKRKNLVSSH